MTTPEEYEKERKDGFKSIAIGGTDFNGNKIYGVYVKSNEYAIYSVDSNFSIKGIKVLIGTEDPDNDVPINNYQSIKIEFDQLKAISNRCTDSCYASRVAHALSVAIYGKTDESKKILAEIRKNILDEYKELVAGKMAYLSGALIAAFITCVIGLYLYLEQPKFVVIDRRPIYELIMVCSLATLGVVISVSRNISSINIDKGSGKIFYFYHGVGRNIFSIIGGIFIFFLIRSNLLFGFVNTLENALYAILVFAFMAGFSETLVPNVLKKLEDRANDESISNP